eukprot:763303-Hanusia_phi.AAC.12
MVLGGGGELGGGGGGECSIFHRLSQLRRLRLRCFLASKEVGEKSSFLLLLSSSLVARARDPGAVVLALCEKTLHTHRVTPSSPASFHRLALKASLNAAGARAAVSVLRVSVVTGLLFAARGLSQPIAAGYRVAESPLPVSPAADKSLLHLARAVAAVAVLFVPIVAFLVSSSVSRQLLHTVSALHFMAIRLVLAQLDEQPSFSATFPSSQASVTVPSVEFCRFPSPQMTLLHSLLDPTELRKEQAEPGSTLHSWSHPSPGYTLPSSHSSSVDFLPSPHLDTHSVTYMAPVASVFFPSGHALHCLLPASG